MKLLFSPAFWTSMLLLLVAFLAAYAGDVLTENTSLKARATQQQAALRQLQAEQDRGDALTTGLLTQQATIDQLTQEAHRAISTQTTGRACLGSAALRVLNAAPGVSTRLAPASSPAAAHGPATSPADDEGSAASSSGDEFATDTQIADWAIDAAAQYTTCRNRLDKLIDWHGAP